MTPFVQDTDFTLWLGDVRDVLPTLPDGSVDCVATSPPFYGLRDYGTGTWSGGDSDCDHSRSTPSWPHGVCSSSPCSPRRPRDSFRSPRFVSAPARHREGGTLTTITERWHKQTLLGGDDVPEDERGDCVRACITSILGLPLDAIENTHGDGWWDRLQDDVAKHGYTLALLDVRYDPPSAYWIAHVPSLNLGPEKDGQEALHSVVCCGYSLAHEPGIGAKVYDQATWTQAWNDGKVAEGWVLVAIDPAKDHAAV